MVPDKLPRNGNKMGVVESESPSSILLWPPGQVNDLHDLRSREAYDF